MGTVSAVVLSLAVVLSFSAGVFWGVQSEFLLHCRFCWCSECEKWRERHRKLGQEPPGKEPRMPAC